MVEYQNRSTLVPLSHAGIPFGKVREIPPCLPGVIRRPFSQIHVPPLGHRRRRVNHIRAIGSKRIPTGVYNTTLPVPGIPHFREFAISRLPPRAPPPPPRAAARDFATLPLLPPRLEESTGGGGGRDRGGSHASGQPPFHGAPRTTRGLKTCKYSWHARAIPGAQGRARAYSRCDTPKWRGRGPYFRAAVTHLNGEGGRLG